MGFVDQLRRVGDVLPASLGLHAIHVKRDDDGLHAAFNAKPFGGCMSIPLQCAGAKRIRCPNMACAFSEDPGVLDADTDPSGALRRQFVGDHPSRLVSIPLTLVGPLIFVYVGFSDPSPFAAHSNQIVEALSGADSAVRISEQEVAVHWETGTRSVADKLGAELRLMKANLVVGLMAEVTVAALFRPLGPQRCSVLSAVLRTSDLMSGAPDGQVAEWRRLVSSTDAA